MGLAEQTLRPRPRIPALHTQSIGAAWLPPGADAIASLTPFGCRFPIGEVAADDFHFCGQLRERGAYCAAHRQLAYAGLAS